MGCIDTSIVELSTTFVRLQKAPIADMQLAVPGTKHPAAAVAPAAVAAAAAAQEERREEVAAFVST